MKNALELPTGTWVLDTSATTLTVSAKMMLAFTVPATLTVSSSSVEIADGEVVTVDVTADASSYTSKMAKRNEHVVSPDFLDAAKYPKIQFQASYVGSSAAGGTAKGSITMKGRTAPVQLTITKIAFDGDTATFEASGSVARADLGVDKFPSLIIGSKLDVTVSATARRAYKVN